MARKKNDDTTTHTPHPNQTNIDDKVGAALEADATEAARRVAAAKQAAKDQLQAGERAVTGHVYTLLTGIGPGDPALKDAIVRTDGLTITVITFGGTRYEISTKTRQRNRT